MSNADELLANRRQWAVINDDCIRGMRALPDGCVHCVATSPPYYALRDYGHEGQIGLEETPAQYVAKMVEVFREVRRILHPSGVLWLNLGDSYAANRGQQVSQTKHKSHDYGESNAMRVPDGLKPKDLVGIPWRVAFGLQQDGWYLRQWMPWVKRNSMPESATDRPSTACETVFLLTKSPSYFFDMEAVKRETVSETPAGNTKGVTRGRMGAKTGWDANPNKEASLPEARNFRSADLWFDSVGMLLADDECVGLDVPLKSYKGAHFATWPPKLVEPMILAGTSAKGVCPHCGEPWRRVVKKVRRATRPGTGSKVTGDTLTDGNRDPERHVTVTETVGWEQGCKCPTHEPIPPVVFDPFTGSGTTLAVAVEHGRRALGTELNPEYMPLIRERMAKAQPPLFSEVA